MCPFDLIAELLQYRVPRDGGTWGQFARHLVGSDKASGEVMNIKRGELSYWSKYCYHDLAGWFGYGFCLLVASTNGLS